MIFHQVNQLASTTRSINTTSNPQVPICGSDTRLDTRDELGFSEEMVLVKMLMEIDPLPMRGSLVMISPSRREVSPAELRLSPRLIPPRFRLVAAEFRPVSLPTIFSRVHYKKKTHL